MADPYRDELVALRVENERLRAQLAVRGRRDHLIVATVSELVLGAVSLGLLQLLLPLLNASSDARFWIGVLGVVILFGVDVTVVVTIARRFTRPRGDERHTIR